MSGTGNATPHGISRVQKDRHCMFSPICRPQLLKTVCVCVLWGWVRECGYKLGNEKVSMRPGVGVGRTPGNAGEGDNTRGIRTEETSGENEKPINQDSLHGSVQ